MQRYHHNQYSLDHVDKGVIRKPVMQIKDSKVFRNFQDTYLIMDFQADTAN